MSPTVCWGVFEKYPARIFFKPALTRSRMAEAWAASVSEYVSVFFLLGLIPNFRAVSFCRASS